LFAIERWQHYLIGNKFLLETDHKPLAWIKSKKDCRGKLGRMALRLAEFDFETNHIPGTANSDADALSRILVNSIDESYASEIQKNKKKFMQIHENWYFREGKNNLRLCLNKEQQKQILIALHDEHGHVGANKFLDIVRKRFYWKNLRNDIRQWVRKCKHCATKKDLVPPPTKAPMEEVDLSNIRTFEKVAIDILGPLAKSKDGNKYIFVMQDYYSKWVEAKPSYASETKTVNNWLSEVFSRNGVPKEIISDHGAQFDSKDYKEFCSKQNIKIMYSTPYHHQANGMVERLNRSLLNILRMYVDEKHDNWDEFIEQALFAYRTCKHSITGESPFKIMFSREPRLSVDNQFETMTFASEKKISNEKIKNNLHTLAKRRKENYDFENRVKVRKFKTGEKVYWKKPQTKIGTSAKLTPIWSGPFKIKKNVSNVNYEIEGCNKQTALVHINYLKKCYDDDEKLAQIRHHGRPRKLIHPVAESFEVELW